MSGFGVAAARIGAPDTGLLSFGEVLDQGRALVEATSHIPIIAVRYSGGDVGGLYITAASEPVNMVLTRIQHHHQTTITIKPPSPSNHHHHQTTTLKPQNHTGC